MAPDSAAARLRYLDHASQCLLTSSPAISAHLETVRQEVAEEKGNSTSSEPFIRSCTACGNILVPGWSCKSIRETLPKRTRKDRIAKEKNPGVKVLKWQCSKCDAVTAIEAAKAGRQRIATVPSSRTASLAQKETPIPTSTKPSEATSNTSKASKKRAKGKKSSLQTMLANHNKLSANRPEGFGLDLMDLMKS